VLTRSDRWRNQSRRRSLRRLTRVTSNSHRSTRRHEDVSSRRTSWIGCKKNLRTTALLKNNSGTTVFCHPITNRVPENSVVPELFFNNAVVRRFPYTRSTPSDAMRHLRVVWSSGVSWMLHESIVGAIVGATGCANDRSV